MSTLISSRKYLTWISFLILFNSTSKCEICVQGKHVQVLFHSIIRNSEPLELVHSNACDSNRVLTRGDRRYFVTFIDDHFKFCYAYLLKSKDDILDWFKVYKAEAENQLERKIKILRFDRREKYTSNDITGFCQEHGIIHEVTAPYTSIQQCSWMKEHNIDGHGKLHVTQLRCTREPLEWSSSLWLFYSQ